MKTILVCNQKGGVGKSMIADELAFALERDGIRHSFYDMDPQGGNLHETAEDEQAKVQVIDTPGALQKELTSWISKADLVIIPTRPTSRDLPALEAMVEIVRQNAKKGAKAMVVVNCWNRYSASSDFVEYIQEFVGAKNRTTIVPQSEIFVRAAVQGKSVVEYAPKSKPAAAVRELVNATYKLLGMRRRTV